MLIEAGRKGAYRVAGWHDPLSARMIGLIFRPQNWVAATEYGAQDSDNYDVVMPTVFTGLYYKVVNPGVSGTTEPVWNKVVGEQTVDGTTGLIFETCLYNLMPLSETITSVTFAADNGVTLSNTSNTTTTFQFMITPLPQAAIDAGEFTVTIVVTKSNTEQVSVELRFKVG